jgi:pilus assembly protein CpaF
MEDNIMRTMFAGEEISRLKTYLIAGIQRELEDHPPVPEEHRQVIEKYINQAITNPKLRLPISIQQELFRIVADELAGYGPIQQFLDDPEVTEVMVNRADRVYIERKGKLLKTGVRFDNDDHVMKLIEKIVLPLGRHIDTDNPSVDARLPDGSRVNAIIPPVAIDGPSLTIRKFAKERLGVKELIKFGSMTKSMAEFLEACVKAKLNIIISGGTGSGKTTLLNILSGFIPEDERIVSIEDAAELQLHQDHVVRLETKSPNIDGRGEVTIRALVRNSLRMRPDRIIVGEVRGGEALDMLQALNTGHGGSLTTIHANSSRDALSRLETLSLMADVELPVTVIRKQIASAVDVIVQQSRLTDGSRKVTNITEVGGMEGDIIVTTDIFNFEQTGVTPDGKVLGESKPTGIRPFFMDRLEKAGFSLGSRIFFSTEEKPYLDKFPRR